LIYTVVAEDLFLVVSGSTACGFLKNDGKAKFSGVAVSDMLERRLDPALCSFRDCFIFASGGDVS